MLPGMLDEPLQMAKPFAVLEWVPLLIQNLDIVLISATFGAFTWLNWLVSVLLKHSIR